MLRHGWERVAKAARAASVARLSGAGARRRTCWGCIAGSICMTCAGAVGGWLFQRQRPRSCGVAWHQDVERRREGVAASSLRGLLRAECVRKNPDLAVERPDERLVGSRVGAVGTRRHGFARGRTEHPCRGWADGGVGLLCSVAGRSRCSCIGRSRVEAKRSRRTRRCRFGGSVDDGVAVEALCTGDVVVVCHRHRLARGERGKLDVDRIVGSEFCQPRRALAIEAGGRRRATRGEREADVEAWTRPLLLRWRRGGARQGSGQAGPSCTVKRTRRRRCKAGRHRVAVCTVDVAGGAGTAFASFCGLITAARVRINSAEAPEGSRA